jgi:hypothetical protein
MPQAFAGYDGNGRVRFPNSEMTGEINKMPTIFLLTDGEFSDIEFVAAFSDRTMAEEAKTAGLGDCIEELELNPEWERPPIGTAPWRVRIHAHGALDGQPWIASPYKDRRIVWPREPALAYVGGPDGKVYGFTCFARDQGEARTLCLQKFESLKAAGQLPRSS